MDVKALTLKVDVSSDAAVKKLDSAIDNIGDAAEKADLKLKRLGTTTRVVTDGAGNVIRQYQTMSQTFARAGETGGLLTGVFERLKETMVALGLAFGVEFIVEFLKRSVEFVAHFADVSDQVHVGVVQLQALNNAAREAGIGVETMEQGILRLNEAIGEATGGDKKFRESFAALGVAFNDASGHSRSTQAVLLDLAKAYAEAGDKTRFTSDLTNVMGRNAGRLVPVLEQLSSGWDAFTMATSNAGIASDQMARDLDHLGDTVGGFVNWLKIKGAEAVHGWQLLLGVGLTEQTQISIEFDKKWAELQKLRTRRQSMLGEGLPEAMVNIAAPLDTIIKLEDDLRDLQKRQAKILELQNGPVGPPTRKQFEASQFTPPASQSEIDAHDRLVQSIKDRVAANDLLLQQQDRLLQAQDQGTAAIEEANKASFVENALQSAHLGDLKLTNAEREKFTAIITEQAGKLFDSNKIIGINNKLIDENTNLQDHYGRVLEDIMTPQERFSAAVAHLDDIYAHSTMTLEEYRREFALLKQDMADQQRDQVERSRDPIDGIRRAFGNYIEQATDLAHQLDVTLTDVFHNAEDALVSFVRTGKISFKSLVNSMLDDLARLAVQQALGGLLGALFKFIDPEGAGLFDIGSGNPVARRAAGGPVSAGRVYQVNERGPEYFIPSTSGTVVPSRGHGGSVVQFNGDINITTQGSSGNPAADQKHAEAIGRETQKALKEFITKTVVEQTRPGGVLNPGGLLSAFPR